MRDSDDAGFFVCGNFVSRLLCTVTIRSKPAGPFPMTPFETFILPARMRQSLWRFALGIVLILCFWVLGIALVIVVAPLVWQAGSDYGDALDSVLESTFPIESPQGVLTMLAMFAGIWAGVYLAGRLHGQSFGRFFAASGGRGFSLLLKGAVFGIIWILGSTMAGLPLVNDLRSGLDLGQWAPFLLPVVALVFVQATAEELIFRGYLLQQFAVRSRHWIIWAAVPSFLFGLLHYSPDLPDGGGYYYVVNTFLFGLVCCALVRRSGSLWPAVGLHVTINIFASTIVGAEGIVTGTQLWNLDLSDVVPTMKADLIVSVLMLGFVLSPLGRVFDENTPDSGGSGVEKQAV